MLDGRLKHGLIEMILSIFCSASL